MAIKNKKRGSDMEKQYFYTIKKEGKYINSNAMKEDTNIIAEAIRFDSEEAVLDYWNSPIVEKMRSIFKMQIIEVECIVKEYV